MHFLVVDVVALLPIAHFDIFAEIGSIASGRKATAASLDACQYGQQTRCVAQGMGLIRHNSSSNDYT
jgi:hypothetical protein